MANFDRSGMTQAGINLMGKAVGGATIQFTKLVLGDGTITGEILDLQGVVSPKQNVDVTRIERNDNQCTVGGELLTKSVKQGFFWRECGLYAMDPDVGEILYNYAYSTKPDFIASSDSGMMEEILVSMVATVGSNANIDITIDDSMVMTTKREFVPVKQKVDDLIVSVKDFGAKGDGITDDTQAFKDAIAHIINQRTILGEKLSQDTKYTLFAPAGWYKVTDTIEIDRLPMDVKFDGNIVYAGERTKPVVKIISTKRCNYKFNVLADINSYNSPNMYAGWHGWETEEYKGIETINLQHCNFDIERIVNFTVGFEAHATNGDGWWFNNTTIKDIANCKVGLHIRSTGINSWINANYFYDSSIGRSGSGQPFTTSEIEKYDVKQTIDDGNEYGGNSNTFYNFKFEHHGTTNATCIYIVKAAAWTFKNTRCELSGNEKFAVIDCINTNLDSVSGAHSRRIVFEDFLFDQNVKIYFINTENIKVPLEDIARIGRYNNKYLIYNDFNFNKNALNVVKGTHCVTKNYLFNDIYYSSVLNSALIKSTYKPITINNDESIYFDGYYAIGLILDNFKFGDEIVLEGTTPTTVFNLKFFDKNGNFISYNHNNKNVIGSYGSYTSDTKIFRQHEVSNIMRFSINSDDLGYILVRVSNKLKGFKILSSNPSVNVNRFTESMSNHAELDGKYRWDSKPTSTSEDVGVRIGTKVYDSRVGKVGNYWEYKKILGGQEDWVYTDLYATPLE